MYIYPNNLKDKKVFLGLVVFDLVILGVLVVFAVIYSSRILSLIPLIFPISFFILKVRLLENTTNIWEHLVKIFKFLVSSQQEYRWESNYVKNKKE